jgi:hypothetical protein
VYNRYSKRDTGRDGMNKKFTIERDGQVKFTLVRQMAHDTQYKIGSKFKYGSGKCWIVTAIEQA